MERIVCRNCGKLSVPAPTCEKCGEQLQEKRSVTRSFKITETADQIISDISKNLFVQKSGDAAGTIELLARFAKRAFPSDEKDDDDDARRLRRTFFDAVKIYIGEEADTVYAWRKSLDLQEKRGPKPQGDSKK